MNRSLCLLCLILLACIVAPSPSWAKKTTEQWRADAAAKYKGNPTDAHKKVISENLPEATVKPAAEHKILVFHRCEGFIHTSIPFGNYAIKALGGKTGAFSVDLADEYEVFTAENLAQYDAIIFNNTTHLDPNEAQRAAILEFIESGKGVVGLHAAGDNFGKWPEGVALIGGIFDGHPWTAGGTWAFKLDDADHILNAAFGGEGFWHKDEIYWYKPENFQGRDKLRVLLSLDMSKTANLTPLEAEKWQEKLSQRGVDPQSIEQQKEIDVPVSWCREYGEGRLFYTNFGHNDMTFADTTILLHMLDGIQYALGDLEAEDIPSSKAKTRLVLAPETSE